MRVILLLGLGAALVLLGVNLGVLAERRPEPTTPPACVHFAEASDDLVRFTRSFARVSASAASAAIAGNAQRLTRTLGHLDALSADLDELIPRYTSTKEECLS